MNYAQVAPKTSLLLVLPNPNYSISDCLDFKVCLNMFHVASSTLLSIVVNDVVSRDTIMRYSP